MVKFTLLPKAKELLGLIKQVKGSYSICTSPLADDPRSEPHKREWIKNNLSFFPPNNVYVTHNKSQFATQKDGTPNILIDDYGVNIDSWEKAGGIGFKYKDYKFQRTAKEIKQKIKEPATENFADGKKKVNEVLDNPAPYTWRKDEHGFPTAEAKELGLHISFDGRNQPDWEVTFYREQDDGSIVMNRPTGQGQEFQVFATVNAAIKDFMKMQDDVEGLTLDARKDGGVDGQGRVSLYRRMMNNYAKKLGKIIVITRGENGAIAIKGDEIFECGIQKNLKIPKHLSRCSDEGVRTMSVSYTHLTLPTNREV